MSGGHSTRFQKGRSGNPAGRPKKRQPGASAFDVIFDQTLKVTQGGVERELTVDEGLQLQTYQAALKGNRMAIRTILKMIARREAWFAAKAPPSAKGVEVKIAREGRTADEALLLLGLVAELAPPEGWGKETGRLLKIQPWVVEEGLRRTRGRAIPEKEMEEIRRRTYDPDKPTW